MKNELFNDFKYIVSNNIPLIDVRAPIEFHKGSFRDAVNLPILNDEERHVIGIKYKQKGNEEATKLGMKLVSGDIKQKRVNDWLDFINKNDNAMLFCFRGGSRSKIATEWIRDKGVHIKRLEGGYKAFRNYLLSVITKPFDERIIPITLGGHTGSGKTIVIKNLKNAIDLEGIANHRGSGFGNNVTPQPTQINFENNLAYEFIHFMNKNLNHLVVEDESRNIGRAFLNHDIYDFFRSKYMVILESTFDERVENTFDEYVIRSQKEHVTYYDSDGINKWYEYIDTSMNKVKKRLGLELFREIMTIFNKAHHKQLNQGDASAHKEWIAIFLEKYYDPMYAYQMEHSTRKILYRGNAKEITEYLNDLS